MTRVTPGIGYYLVGNVDADGIRTHLVGKDKTCTCGGHAKRWCSHIRAVAEYLKGGGERAPTGDTAEFVHDSNPAKEPQGIPEACPICRRNVRQLGPSFWRCEDDSSHYWRWRGEQNGAAIRKFLTEPHPAKQGSFYEMTEEERDTFLLQAAQRMHRDGYTPYNGKESPQ